MKKRIISLLMALLMVVTLLPVTAMAEELVPASPSGEEVVSDEAAAEPSGEEEAPSTPEEPADENISSTLITTSVEYIEINTVDDLNNIRNNLSASYILMQDLDLSSLENWEPIGQVNAPFQGSFDGNGHVIRNMRIDQAKTATSETPSYCYGLFGVVDGGSIFNVGIANSSINVTYDAEALDSSFCQVGGIAGYITKGSIYESFFAGSITVTTTGTAYLRVAGIVAEAMSDSIITDCFSNARISATAEKMNLMVAGIAAYLDHGSINKCYAAGTISAKNYNGYCYFGGINASATRDAVFGIVLDYFGHVQNSVVLLKTAEIEGASIVRDDIGKLSENTNCKVIDITADEAFAQSTYAALGWDFTDTWTMGGDLPCLQYSVLPSTIFSAKRNGWGFLNHWNGFSYPDDYSIPEERYKEVFGSSYVAAAKLAGGDVLESMMPKWQGSCAGMGLAATQFFTGNLFLSDYTNTAKTANQFYDNILYAGNNCYISAGKTSRITQLIEKCHILFNRSDIRADIDEYFYNVDIATYATKEYITVPKLPASPPETFYSYRHNPGGNYIANVLSAIKSSDSPVLVGLFTDDGGHLVVTRTDKSPQCMADGWTRVYIYDPNTPWINEIVTNNYDISNFSYALNHLAKDDRYIELNPSTNQWRYIGNVNDVNNRTYWGSDAEGAVKYIIDSSNKEYTICPDILILYPLKIDCTSFFNGSAPWTRHNSDSVKLLFSRNSSFSVVSPNGNTLYQVENGTPAPYLGPVEYYPSLDYIEGAEDPCSSGQIIIPSTESIIQYESGSDISIIGNDSVINIAADGGLCLNISMEGNSLQISSVKGVNIAIQITDIYSNNDYTSAEVNGHLALGDEFSISLKNDELSISGELSNSELTLFVDSSQQPEVVQLNKVSGDNNDIHIPDVRNAAISKDKITVAPEKLFLTIAEEVSLTAIASNDASITWASSNPQVVSVNDAGIVTGVAYGTATVTATLEEGFSASCQVIVAPTLKGDINRDGRINISDVQQLYEYLTRTNTIITSQPQAVADVNGDGSIDVYDLQRLYEAVSGIRAF